MRKFKLMCFDVDGCLTTGQVMVSPSGDSFVFDVQDGLGIKLLPMIGVECIAISGKKDPSVARRLASIGIDDYYGGVSDKLSLLRKLALEKGVDFSEIVYMGDDLIDIPCMKAVGYSIAPANCVHEVGVIADKVLTKRGGEGAAREAVSAVFTLMGESPEVVFLRTLPDCSGT